MNIQQQNKINTLWEGILKGLVLALVKQFGTAALEWLKNKLDELIENGEADEAVNDEVLRNDTNKCLGIAKPTTPPDGAGPNGHYTCTTTGWKWVEDIG